MSTDPDAFRQIAEEQRAMWERLAGYWHVQKTTDAGQGWIEMVNAQPGDVVLDVGCGDGWASRLLASRGAAVVAVDASKNFIDIARSKGDGEPGHIDYRALDATDENALQTLVERPFDSVVANMVLMNLWTTVPLARSLPRLLKPGGRFVFTVLHPCFPSPFDLRADERGAGRAWRRVSQWVVKRNLIPAVFGRAALRVTRPLLVGAAQRRYFQPSAIKVVGPGEPASHYNFHRPLSALLRPFLAEGLVIDALQEETRDYAADLPNVLAVRLRLPP